MPKPVLLLLPGLTCDAAAWGPQIAAFTDGYDVRVADFFGLDSIEAMARQALALTDGPFALAGHSMGGRVALQVSAMAPARVERIALLDTGAHPAVPGEAAARQQLIDIGEAGGMAAVTEAWLPPMLAQSRRRDPDLWDLIGPMQHRAGLAVLKGQIQALLARPDGWPQLDALRCPTAFIVGEEDAWSPPAQHAAMQARVPGATLTVIPDCGHMATLEAPTAVNDALRAWLQA